MWKEIKQLCHTGSPSVIYFNIKFHTYFLLSQGQLWSTRAASRAALRGGQQRPPDASTSLYEQQDTQGVVVPHPQEQPNCSQQLQQMSHLKHFGLPAVCGDEGSGTKTLKIYVSLPVQQFQPWKWTTFPSERVPHLSCPFTEH